MLQSGIFFVYYIPSTSRIFSSYDIFGFDFTNELFFSCPPFDLPKTDTAVKLQIEAEFLSSVVKRFTLIENTVGK